MSPSELLPALPFKLAQRGLHSCLLATKKPSCLDAIDHLRQGELLFLQKNFLKTC